MCYLRDCRVFEYFVMLCGVYVTDECLSILLCGIYVTDECLSSLLCYVVLT